MSRAPHGARGLKPLSVLLSHALFVSRPTRGAWIETDLKEAFEQEKMSRPTRGAWIETFWDGERHIKLLVAPHTGRVD